MLLSLLHYQFTKKQDGEKDLIRPLSPSGFEIVFLLLVKAIVVKM